MMLIRKCDSADCENDALFMVAAYDEEDEVAETADVCGVQHAKEWISGWLKDMADIEAAIS